MKLPNPTVNYRDFRLSKINQEEYRHLKYLLFWPALIARYIFVERIYPVEQYFPVHCALDDVIPFCEAFIIPYGCWYAIMIAMHLYTMLYDVPAFKRYSRYLLIAFSMSSLIFLLFPTCQNLRPAELPRDNILCRVVEALYRVDTNTNVCPSEHVIGSVAVVAAAWNIPKLRSPGKMTLIITVAVLICLSTLFLKQHSAVDVIAALPICAIAYWFCYGKENLTRKKNDPQRQDNGK